MTNAHWPRFAALSLLSFAILFQYQNCAPGGQQTGASAVSDSDNIVNGFSSTAVATQAVQLSSSVVRMTANQAEASVTGSCLTANTPTLGWTLKDPETGEDLAKGSTACVDNAFNMELADNSSIECNKVYDLQINEAEGSVTKDCQN